MIKLSISMLVLLALLAGSTANVALAQSPHFLRAGASGPDNDGDLTVTWKEAGLGDNLNINYTASANGTAEYACINGGGNHPQAANKETVSAQVTSNGTFSVKNGSVTASLTIEPPGPGTFSCPGGQRLVFVSVTYTNVSITDTTNNLSESIPGTFSRVFFTF